MSTPVVAITGANGYIGNLVANALEPDISVVRLVRRPKNPGQVAWSFHSDPVAMEKIFRQHHVTYLIHASWDMKENAMAALERSCVDGSRNLFAAAQSAGVKLIFISTISAFPGARSAYGRAKLQVEDMALRAQGVSLRLGLVFGDGEGGVFGNPRPSSGRQNSCR